MPHHLHWHNVRRMSTTENPLADFLAEVDAFLVETGTAPTALGRGALGDPSFVFNLRDGRDCRMSTIVRVREWMRAQREQAA